MEIRFWTLFFFDTVDFYSGGRFSWARLQPSPSLRSVRVLPLGAPAASLSSQINLLFLQKSPPPFQSTRTTFFIGVELLFHVQSHALPVSEGVQLISKVNPVITNGAELIFLF